MGSWWVTEAIPIYVIALLPLNFPFTSCRTEKHQYSTQTALLFYSLGIHVDHGNRDKVAKGSFRFSPLVLSFHFVGSRRLDLQIIIHINPSQYQIDRIIPGNVVKIKNSSRYFRSLVIMLEKLPKNCSYLQIT